MESTVVTSSPASSRASSPRNCISRASSSRSTNKSPLSVQSDSEKNNCLKMKNEDVEVKGPRNSFSIQSILARPEPLRPSEHPMSYAHILQANFSNYMPPKFIGQQGMLFPWMPKIPPDVPENLSTKSFLTTHSAKSRNENFKNSPVKSEKAQNQSSAPIPSTLKNENPSAGSRSPSPCPSFDEDDDACKSPSSPNSNSRRKKTRTVFSRNQVFQLESMFDMKRYLSSSERASLAASLNLSEQQIKIWFQNRRNKWKRQLCSDLDANSMTVGAHGPGRFPPHHLSLPMYSFPSAINGENTPNSSAGMMPNLFCPGAMHPLFMGGHLPFSRPTV